MLSAFLFGVLVGAALTLVGVMLTIRALPRVVAGSNVIDLEPRRARR